MKSRNKAPYTQNTQGVSVKVSYPSAKEAKVKTPQQAETGVNFMGLGQFSDWL